MVATMTGLQEARAVAGVHFRVLGAAMTAGFAAGQIAGPLLVSALAGRADGLGEALGIAFAALAVSVVALAYRGRA
jgi:hypothetical protein